MSVPPPTLLGWLRRFDRVVLLRCPSVWETRAHFVVPVGVLLLAAHWLVVRYLYPVKAEPGELPDLSYHSTMTVVISAALGISWTISVVSRAIDQPIRQGFAGWLRLPAASCCMLVIAGLPLAHAWALRGQVRSAVGPDVEREVIRHYLHQQMASYALAHSERPTAGLLQVGSDSTFNRSLLHAVPKPEDELFRPLAADFPPTGVVSVREQLEACPPERLIRLYREILSVELDEVGVHDPKHPSWITLRFGKAAEAQLLQHAGETKPVGLLLPPRDLPDGGQEPFEKAAREREMAEQAERKREQLLAEVGPILRINRPPVALWSIAILAIIALPCVFAACFAPATGMMATTYGLATALGAAVVPLVTLLTFFKRPPPGLPPLFVGVPVVYSVCLILFAWTFLRQRSSHLMRAAAAVVFLVPSFGPLLALCGTHQNPFSISELSSLFSTAPVATWTSIVGPVVLALPLHWLLNRFDSLPD